MLLVTACMRADWADDQLANMSLEQKVGQVFMPSFRVGKVGDYELMIKLISDYQVGGILLLRGTLQLDERHSPVQEAMLINELQRHADTALLISQDFEWGLSQCLKQVIRFPHNMTLGALENKQLIYELGKEIGRQCKLLGVHINFAPVVDVNSNPKNPVIHDRSFGSNIEEVTERALLYMQGMHDAGILSCAKHFPGHGDTDVDSHYALPVLRHSKELLIGRELYPFQKMIEHNVPMIMTAHLHIPVLDDMQNMPASLSKAAVTDLLKKELGYQGVIVTDGLAMQGVSDHFNSGDAAVMAVLAGNDLLIDSKDPIEAIDAVLQAVRVGIISEERLNESVYKILRMKQSMGLDAYQEQAVPSHDQFHTKEAYYLKGQLYSQAITLVRDREGLLPLKHSPKTAALFIEQQKVAIHKHADDTSLVTFSLKPDATNVDIFAIENELAAFDSVVVCLFGMNKYMHKRFGISPANQDFIKRLQKQGKKVVLAIFGTPYAVALFDDIDTVIVAYEDDIDAQYEAARVILGKSRAQGKLPV